MSDNPYEAGPNTSPESGETPEARLAQEGSAIFLGDLIESIQATLDLASEAADREHAFSIVRFDATASLSFQLNNKTTAQGDQDDKTDTDESTRPAARKGMYHRLISLFSHPKAAVSRDRDRDDEASAKSSSTTSMQETGSITLHMQFQPQNRRSASRGAAAVAPGTPVMTSDGPTVPPAQTASVSQSDSAPSSQPQASSASNPFASTSSSTDNSSGQGDSSSASTNPFA